VKPATRNPEALGEGKTGSLLVVVGPTAVGKTGLAVQLGQALGGEVVSADSRQVYRGMDIGTAKPTVEERTQTPHHLIDIRNPDDPLSLAEYQALAYRIIDNLLARGKLPMLVGGTGQYVRAVVEGWNIPAVPPDDALRAELYAEAEAAGHEALHARLRALDPVAAERIDARNVRRVIRALEVCLVAGRPISELQRKSPSPYLILQIGLTRPRAILYRRADDRIERMMAAGLVDEVRRLVAAGYNWHLPAMSSLGYRQIGAHLRGETSLEEAVQSIKRETRRFIRHQYNWFRPSAPHIRWFDLEVTLPSEIETAVTNLLAQIGDRTC
jgi:tRNA dimethylallyltransferase